MEQHIIYVGLDVHKDTIAVALAEARKRGEVREHGKVLNAPAALKTLATKLARNGCSLRFCNEATAEMDDRLLGACHQGGQKQGPQLHPLFAASVHPRRGRAIGGLPQAAQRG